MTNRRTILCVEDNEDDVVLLKSACRKCQADFQLRWVADGQQAIEYLTGASPFDDRAANPLPDVVLLDINMPRKNGLEVLGWVRSEAPSPVRETPVLIFTSSQHETDIRKTYELGADHYLMKPLDYDELVEMVGVLKSLLNGHENLQFDELSKLRHYRQRPHSYQL